MLEIVILGSTKVKHTKVLHKDFARGSNSRFIDNASLAILEGLFGRRIKQSNAVVVADLGRLCDQDFKVFNGDVGIKLDRGGQILDGLLRSYGELVFEQEMHFGAHVEILTAVCELDKS